MKKILPFLLIGLLSMVVQNLNAQVLQTSASPLTWSYKYGVNGAKSFSITDDGTGNFIPGETITATASAGFEISIDGGATFHTTVTFSTDAFITDQINQAAYVRVAGGAIATNHVGTYNGTLTVSALSATTINPVLTATITPKNLTINPTVATRPYDQSVTPGTVTLGTITGTVFGQTVTTNYVASNYANGNVGSHATTLTYTLINGDGLLNGTGLSTDYSLANSTPSGSITAIPLTITGLTVPDKFYDGTNSATINGPASLVGVLSGDDVSLTGGNSGGSFATSTFNDATVGTNKPVSYTTDFGITGTQSGNYTLPAQPTLTGRIKPRILLTATPPTVAPRIYDGTATAGTVTVGTLSGFLPGETVTATGVGSDYPDAEVQTGKATMVTYTLHDGTGGGLAANYQLDPEASTGDITVRPITVTADPKSKAYGVVADPALTYQVTSGTLINPAHLTGSLTRVAGNAVGTYAINQGSLVATSNYSLTFVPGVFTISKKAITVTADPQTKVYGQSDPTFTYAITSGTLEIGDALTGALSRAAGENVGTRAINIGTLDNANYDITLVPDNLTITPKGITVTADAKSKSYGAVDPALTYTVNVGGLEGTDALTGSLTRAAGESVGTYLISQGSLANSNYSITYIDANLTIGAKVITVTADPQSKSYGSSDPTLTYIFSPALQGGDSFSGSLDRVAGENVGSYAITQGTLSLSSDYTINYVSNNLTITRKNVTVTADSKSKIYGDLDPAFTYSATGLVLLETLTGTLSRNAGEPAGTYTITQGTVNNANNPNYNIFYVVNNLTINRKPITVTADPKTKVYGSSDPAFTFAAPGLVPGDVLIGSLSRPAGEHVGSYPINQGSVNNTANSNYDITYVGDNLTITKKGLTVTADVKSKTYGASDPALTYTTSGLEIGDALTGSLSRDPGETVGAYAINQGTLDNTDYNISYVSANLNIGTKTINVTADPKSKTYGDVDPALTYSSTPALEIGDSFSGSLSRVAGENVGTHSITQGTLSLSSNYNLVYTPDNLTITRKNITVTADPKTKVYGDVDPALTYVVTGGLIPGDVITGTLSRAAGEGVGNHSITQGTVNNSNNPNYNITFAPDNLAITKKPITVTADPQTKVEGTSDPVFTYVVTGGLVIPDVLTGALSRAAGETPATYAITQGTLDNANYNITFVADNLTITAAPGGGGGVPGGGGGGLESKSLGDGVGNRMFNRALNSLQGPIDYNKLPVVNAGGMQNRTTGIGTAMTLTDLLPKQISGTGYKVFNSTPTDLTQLTNAKDVLSIDYTSNNQAKAVAFATKTMGEVYDHTKAVCDRLKGSELLSIQNVLVNGVNMVRYDLKNPAGQTEYAMSFSVGAKNGRNNYTIQSNWLNNDYVADEMMFNVQLWAETPALIMSMANDIVSRLKSGMPVNTVVNGNGIPKTYITKGKRESDNIVLNISNSTASTNGYFEVLQKANEQSTVLTKKQVPFTINANATVNAINVPASDNYESTINMYINGVLQDQVFMTDGNWAANVNTSTGTLKSFKVNNDANRVINDKSDFLLFRNVQVEANVPDFVSLYKVLRGGGAPQDLTGYKTFQFTASGAGAGLNITLIKNGVANWADQYSIVLPLSSTPQDYKISLDDFVSTASKDKINPNDITMVIFGLGVGTGRMSAVSADISNASFSKTDVAYLNSLKSTEISVYPNPVTGNTFTANFKAPSVNNLNLQLTDANSGRVVLSKAITSQVGNNNVTVNFDRQPGISTYILTLEGTSIKYTPKKVMMNK